MSIGITSGRQAGARNLNAALAVRRTEQADIGQARDEILDQHQIGARERRKLNWPNSSIAVIRSQITNADS